MRHEVYADAKSLRRPRQAQITVSSYTPTMLAVHLILNMVTAKLLHAPEAACYRTSSILISPNRTAISFLRAPSSILVCYKIFQAASMTKGAARRGSQHRVGRHAYRLKATKRSTLTEVEEDRRRDETLHGEGGLGLGLAKLGLCDLGWCDCKRQVLAAVLVAINSIKAFGASQDSHRPNMVMYLVMSTSICVFVALM